MNILAIDTSNQTMGVSITKNGQLIGEYVTNIKKNHSIQLMPAIDRLMKDTSVSPKELDMIVVAKGPGSFTGVRIGMSTAKTMAWALKIPIISVSSLEALAYQGSFTDYCICPFFDARRGLVYTGLYSWNENNILEQVEPEKNTNFESWLHELALKEIKVMFLSQDIDIHRDLIQGIMGELAVIPDATYHIPRPSLLALASMSKDPDEIHSLTPNYLRLAEAEAKWLEQQSENN